MQSDGIRSHVVRAIIGKAINRKRRELKLSALWCMIMLDF